jgi:hypothetical protein
VLERHAADEEEGGRGEEEEEEEEEEQEEEEGIPMALPLLRAARGFVSRDGHGHGDILEVLPPSVELTDCIGSRAAGLHESTAGQDIILATVWTITLTLADTVDEFILPL